MAVTRDGRDVVTIFSDASFCHKTKAGGWGFWLRNDSEIRMGGGPLFNVDSSTHAEICAVALSLHHAISEGLVPQRSRVVFGVDNQWVVDTLAGRLKPDWKNGAHPCFEAFVMVQEFKKKW